MNAADAEAELHKATVDAVLRELDAQEVPQLVVLNQVDHADPERVAELAAAWSATAVSALTGQGLPVLLERVERTLFRERASQRIEQAREVFEDLPLSD